MKKSSATLLMLGLAITMWVSSPAQTQDCLDGGGNGTLAFTYSEDNSNTSCCTGGDCQCLMGEVCCITCEAEHLCSIQWFKDGTQINSSSSDGLSYYFSKEVIIYIDPETAKPDYVGNYTCEIANSTHFSVQRVFNVLPIKALPYTGQPLEKILDTCSDQEAILGENVTFYCEFSAKEKTEEIEFDWLRDVSTSITEGNEVWVSVNDLNVTGTVFTSYVVWNISEDEINRERYMGSTLFIENVTYNAYGHYRLVATLSSTNQSTSHNLFLFQASGGQDETIVILAAILGSTILLLFLAAMWFAFNLEMKLFLKDRFGAIEEKGQRSYDAFIAYDSSSEGDRVFVLEFVRRKLMENNYVVYVKDIDTNAGSSLAEEILEAMEISLRCILVISSSFMSSRLMGLQVNAATDQMWEQQTKIIPILFGDMDEKKLKRVNGLSNVMSILRSIKYKEGKTSKSKFLKRLLLRMPKRTKRARVNDMLLDSTSDTAHLTSDLVF